MTKPIRDFDRAFKGVYVAKLRNGHLASLLKIEPKDIRGRGVRFRALSKRMNGMDFGRSQQVILLDSAEIAANVAASIQNIARKLLRDGRGGWEK
jgi:hypothetical protein